jgi:transposase
MVGVPAHSVSSWIEDAARIQGDAENFDNGRQLAAWLGQVPRQRSIAKADY